jgi:hypothetical protein
VCILFLHVKLLLNLLCRTIQRFTDNGTHSSYDSTEYGPHNGPFYRPKCNTDNTILSSFSISLESADKIPFITAISSSIIETIPFTLQWTNISTVECTFRPTNWLSNVATDFAADCVAHIATIAFSFTTANNRPKFIAN